MDAAAVINAFVDLSSDWPRRGTDALLTALRRARSALAGTDTAAEWAMLGRVVVEQRRLLQAWGEELLAGEASSASHPRPVVVVDLETSFSGFFSLCLGFVLPQPMVRLVVCLRLKESGDAPPGRLWETLRSDSIIPIVTRQASLASASQARSCVRDVCAVALSAAAKNAAGTGKGSRKPAWP